MSVIGFMKKMPGHPELPSDILDDINFAWLEGTMEAKIDFFSNLPEWQDLERWPSGRIFGLSCEYRWRQNPKDGLHAVFILDREDLPYPFSGPGKLCIEKTGDDFMILWGDWVDPEKDKESNPKGDAKFYAQELPLVQRYPVPPDEAKRTGYSPRIGVRRYRHRPDKESETKAMGEFARCFDILMAQDEQKGGK